LVPFLFTTAIAFFSGLIGKALDRTAKCIQKKRNMGEGPDFFVGIQKVEFSPYSGIPRG
jgi:hypothetical protein